MEIEIASPPPPAQQRVASGTAAEGGVYQHGRAACLVWQDLTAVLPNFGSGPTRRLLNGISGYALPGRIMAVMGPSGSGKSTFLDSLAGRLSANVVMSGNIYLNGRRRRFNESIVAYVTQETGFLGTLSVRETITYSAMLRMPNDTTKMELKETVERTITEMGLGDCADTLIGNWHLRGISGGEKRRLSIALEIITQPRLLLLDEPTSGLDSAAAFFIAQALRNVARSGRTIVSSIHQPSSEVFTLFDDLLLLSSGETIYFGEAGMAVEFFAEAGFPCPLKRNPSDHFLRSINSDFDTINKTLMGSQRIRDPKDPLAPNMILSTTEIRARLIQKYQTSKFSGQTRATMRELLATEGPVFENIQGSHATWFKQLTTLTRRSFINMCRDFGYYWLRMIVFITVALSAGSVFYRVGYRTDTIRERGACGGYVSGFMTFMTIGGFPSFVEEMKVFSKERLNRHYGIVVYVLSNFLSSFPFLVVMSFGTASIFYFMVHFHPGFSHYIYAVLDLLLSIAVIEGLMMAIAAFVPNFLMGVMIGSGFIGIMMCTAGYFRQLKYLPKIYWRYPIYYINYMSWALKGAFKNEMIGLEFDPIQGGGQKIKGEEVLSSLLGIPINYSKWWDLLAILAILICYRAIFFFALKFKERAMPIYRTYYAKTTLHQLKKRPSFRVTPPSFPSKRHPVVHSLSSQEGLNSPLH